MERSLGIYFQMRLKLYFRCGHSGIGDPAELSHSEKKDWVTFSHSSLEKIKKKIRKIQSVFFFYKDLSDKPGQSFSLLRNRKIIWPQYHSHTLRTKTTQKDLNAPIIYFRGGGGGRGEGGRAIHNNNYTQAVSSNSGNYRYGTVVRFWEYHFNFFEATNLVGHS